MEGGGECREGDLMEEGGLGPLIACKCVCIDWIDEWMDGWSRSMDGRPQDGPRAMADELSGLGRAALLAAAAVRVCETRRGGERRSCARSARYLAERCVVKQEDERSAAWFIEDGLQRKEGHLTCVRRAAVQKSRVDYRPGRKRDGCQTDRQTDRQTARDAGTIT